MTPKPGGHMNEQGSAKLFSKRVKAGKRTYFFDVKATRDNDYYIVLTESRRILRDDQQAYDKQRMFLYKEDFAKFIHSLQETIDYVKNELMPDVDFAQFEQQEPLIDDFGTALKWE